MDPNIGEGSNFNNSQSLFASCFSSNMFSLHMEDSDILPDVTDSPIIIYNKSPEPSLKPIKPTEMIIYVFNPTLVRPKIRTHVVYSIAGRDESGKFETVRRYKEFLSLRSIMRD